MTDWDHTTDFLAVGSGGGGLGAAIAAAACGRDSLVLESTSLIGGSTAMSGGVLWLPCNTLMDAAGVDDSMDDALAYFDAVVGDVGPASSLARRTAYIEQGQGLVRFWQSLGMELLHCEGYSDYYADMRGIPGGKARGRAVEHAAFDSHRLGPTLAKIRSNAVMPDLPIYIQEFYSAMLAKRRLAGAKTAARVGLRKVRGRLRGQHLVTCGYALIASLMRVIVERGIPVWTDSPLDDLVVEDGHVIGAVVRRNGRSVRVKARDGVLLAAGGFARNAEMRAQFGGDQPNTAKWTSANPGDMGDAVRIGMRHGAATDLLDEAWWNPSFILADGTPAFALAERFYPGSMVVDRSGRRYFDEAVSYMEAGQKMYKRDREVGGAVPSWLVFDARYRRRYLLAGTSPGRTQRQWIEAGVLKRGDSLDALANECGIDQAGLRASVERLNRFADAGVDDDFHRGEGASAKSTSDSLHRPNACLGRIDKAPFFALALYPGDVGTSGGLLCDEFARVLDASHRPIPGLYAAGNCTASLMGRAYPAAGASIGATSVFGYIAANHATARAAVPALNTNDQ